MPKNKVEDLRNMLFETIERLMDADDPMDIQRAKAVADVAQVVVNTAKVEIDFVKQTGHGGSGFIGNSQLPPAGTKQLSAVPPIDITPETRKEDLCQACPLPDCDDTSPQCLIQIQKRKAA